MERCMCQKKNGEQCTNKKRPSSQFCGIHKQCKTPVQHTNKKKYKRIRRLGSGGFGEVWLLQAQDGSRFVMKKSLGHNTQEIEKQYTNLKRVSTLHSPFFVRPVLLDSQKKWFIMEYLPAMMPLDTIFHEKTPMTQTARLHLGRSLHDAMNLLHTHGIIHHDIKPANIMVNPKTGDMKLIDFGMSCKKDDCKTTTTVSGTLKYFSPYMLHYCHPSHDSFRVTKVFTYDDYMNYDKWAVGLILLTLTDPLYRNKILSAGKTWKDLRDFYEKEKKKLNTVVHNSNTSIESFFNISDALRP
jgi:serine/threonine protein kinase